VLRQIVGEGEHQGTDSGDEKRGLERNAHEDHKTHERNKTQGDDCQLEGEERFGTQQSEWHKEELPEKEGVGVPEKAFTG